MFEFSESYLGLAAVAWLPADAEPPPEIVELLDVSPGAVLAAAIEDVDLAELDDDGLVSLVSGAERLVAWAQSRQLAAIDRLARGPAPAAGRTASWSAAWPEEIAASEVGCALSVSPREAARRVELAVSLARDLPATFTALAAGRIDLARARGLHEELVTVNDLDPGTRARVEAEVLDRATGWTAPRLRAEARRRVLAVAPRARAGAARAEMPGPWGPGVPASRRDGGTLRRPACDRSDDRADGAGCARLGRGAR